MIAPSIGLRIGLVRWFAVAAFVSLIGFSGPASAQTAITTTLSVTSGGSAVTSVSSGTVVTLTATVMAGTTPVTPGQVKFCDSSATYCEDFHIVGTAQLTSSGTAIFKFRPAVGSHSYKAVFLGTKTNATSISATSSLSVTAPASSVTGIFPTASNAGSWSLTANVSGGMSSYTPPPLTGTVSFIDTSNANAVIGMQDVSGSTVSTGLAYKGNLPAPSSFTPYPDYPEAIADVNGDGIPDVIALARNNADITSSSYIVTSFGNGDGTFSAGVATQLPNSLQGAFLVEADFNGDGIPDVAVVDITGQYVLIMLGNSDGTFSLKSTLSVSLVQGVNPLAVGDFNGDGIPDLAIASLSGDLGNISICLGKGDGTFTALTPIAEETGSLMAADLNGDGISDLVLGGVFPFEADTPVTIVLLSNGDGTFTQTASISPSVAGDFVINVVIADFNGDGIPDLAMLEWGPAGINPILSVLKGAGNGTFTPLSVTNAIDGEDFLGDFNGDGIPDIAILAGAVGYPSNLYLGKGDGTFTPVEQTIPFAEGYPVIEGDLNGDGLTDVLSAVVPVPGANSVGGISVLLGQSGWTASADLTNVSLSPGTHLIAASYSGDTNFNPSISGAEPITMQAASITAPASGAILSPGNNAFTWTTGLGVTQYKLDLGTGGAGSSDLYTGAPITATSATVTGIPLNGATVTATLYSYLGGTWYSTSSTYAEGQGPVLITPIPGIQLAGPMATFTWTPGTGVSRYQLWVGTNWPQAFNIYGSGITTATSATVTGLPTDGVNVYVTLWYEINGVWYYTPYLYTAAGQTAPPVLTTPTPGSTLSGSNVTFTWTPGTGVTVYTLSVGTYAPGSFNIYSSPVLSTTSVTVPNIPTDSKPVYITLRYQINGLWQTASYTYTSAPLANPPVMTSPAPGSVLPGSTVTFQWTPNSNVTQYALSVGTHGPGSANIDTVRGITTNSTTVSGIPTDGKPVYVILWYLVNGAVWQTTSYTYTAQ